MRAPHSSRPSRRSPKEHFDAIFDVNVKGVVFTVQKALPLLPDGASIILNASIVATKGFPQWSVYSATKAALRSFARTWAADLKDRGIRVNAVSPGITDTPGLNVLMIASGAGDQAEGWLTLRGEIVHSDHVALAQCRHSTQRT